MQRQDEGIKMQAEKPPVHKSVHNVHTPLAGQTRDEAKLPVRRQHPSEEDRRREFGFVMSSPQPLAMNE
jgi:hypothetical protein